MMKHKSNPRSEFLSQLMKVIGGDSGTAIISAFTNNDIDKFRDSMQGVTERLVTIIKHKKENIVQKDDQFDNLGYAKILKGYSQTT
jgi:hypothetical protein